MLPIKIQQYLTENLSEMYLDYSGGGTFNFPKFDLFARDYLRFAEHELLQLQKNTNIIEHIHLINCVSHLKRAIDCQLDTCFYILNLQVFKKKNLSLNAKLSFLKSAGIFNTFSLSRFNTIRNKMEHDYKIPDIEDIETYYDLVSALVSILESLVGTLSHSAEIGMRKNNTNDTHDYFSIDYIWDDIPKIKCTIDRDLINFKMTDNVETFISVSKKEYTPQEEIIISSEDRDNFPYFLKILVLLSRRHGYISDKYILDELQNIQ